MENNLVFTEKLLIHWIFLFTLQNHAKRTNERKDGIIANTSKKTWILETLHLSKSCTFKTQLQT